LQEVEDTTTKLVDVIALSENLIKIDKTQYRIVENHDSGFDKERIEERYNNVLEKYDYIVGDWGYDQLRFKGFYEDERKESTLENRISHLEDYLIEYCNFGCAYFVLEKVKKAPIKARQHHQGHQNHPNNRKSNHRFRTRNNANGNNNSSNNNNHAKPGTKAAKTNKPAKLHVNPKKKNKNKNKVAKHRVVTNDKKKVTAPAKKTFKIRKIGEKNK